MSRRTNVGVGLVAFGALLGALVALSYASPRFASSVSRAPVIGLPVQALGLGARTTQPVAGAGLNVGGVYVTSAETVVIMAPTPNLAFPVNASLTDQFLKQYHLQSRFTDSTTATERLTFEHLSDLDTTYGARLRLTLDATGLSGTRTADMVFDPSDARTIALPGDIGGAGAQVQFTSITRTGSAIDIVLRLRPESVDRSRISFSLTGPSASGSAPLLEWQGVGGGAFDGRITWTGYPAGAYQFSLLVDGRPSASTSLDL